jgi:hypothetical protein
MKILYWIDIITEILPISLTTLGTRKWVTWMLFHPANTGKTCRNRTHGLFYGVFRRLLPLSWFLSSWTSSSLRSLPMLSLSRHCIALVSFYRLCAIDYFCRYPPYVSIFSIQKLSAHHSVVTKKSTYIDLNLKRVETFVNQSYVFIYFRWFKIYLIPHYDELLSWNIDQIGKYFRCNTRILFQINNGHFLYTMYRTISHYLFNPPISGSEIFHLILS